MQKVTLVKAGVGVVVATLSLGLASAAHADVAPSKSDAVAVGSDTVQYVADFLADGDTAGDAGYNKNNSSRRLFSFDATGDASGRSAYVSGTSTQLAATAVLRAGTAPVARPNGSGGGITALLNDNGTVHKIDFVRSSRLPKGSEQANAGAPGTTGGTGGGLGDGGLHVFQIATDGLLIVNAAAATNAPAALTAAELANIYTGVYKTWGDIPGYAGPNPSHGIVPVIPQTGSGTRNDFIADIASKTGITLGSSTSPFASNVKVGEEHDPTAITNIATGTDTNGNPISAADGISPFSVGRLNLINTGYFGSTPAANTVVAETGTAPDGSANYFLQRKLYMLARQTDVTSTVKFQLGGTSNAVNTFFGTATSWFAKPGNAALFTASGGNASATDPQLVGVQQAWQDLGFASAS